MLLQFCKIVIFGLKPTQRAVIYLVATCFLSIFCDYSTTSKSYFAHQNNVLNIYFVKLSWGWTLVSLGTFVLVTKSQKNEKGYDGIKGDGIAKMIYFKSTTILESIARLSIATMVWYFGTGLFLMVEDYSGVCNAPSYSNKINCKENGYFWKGFDISGHCFLLVWCNLVILEEVKCFLEWEKVTTDQSNDTNSATNVNLKCTGPVSWLFQIVCFMSMLWDIMIFCTNMYFHTVPEKVLGTIIAITAWFILYRIIYKRLIQIFA